MYVDGSHDRWNCAAELRAYTPKLKLGGIMAGHDFRLETPDQPDGSPVSAYLWGPRMACREVFGEPDRVYADSSYIIYKPHERIKPLK